MKKTTGKVVSLVLALALVVTSFSATFAFASTKSVSGTVSVGGDSDVYLANGAVASVSSLKGIITGTLGTKDHQSVSTDGIIAISHSSGSTLVKTTVDSTNYDAALAIKSTSATGTEVLSVLYQGSYPDSDGNTVTVKGTTTFTVHVLNAGDLVIGTSGGVTAGRTVSNTTFAQTFGSVQVLSVYQIAQKTPGTDALAAYTEVQVATDPTAITAAAALVKSSTTDVKLSLPTAKTFTATVGKGTSADASVANVTITAQKVATGVLSTATADKFEWKTKVEKKVDVLALQTANGSLTTLTGPDYVIYKNGSKTYIKDSGAASTTNDPVVTGAEVAFPATTTGVHVDSGSLKEISGTVGALSIDAATITSGVDVTAISVTVTDTTAKIGDITIEGGAGDVTVTEGKVGNIDTGDATNGDVIVNAGTTGTISAPVTGVVTVKATDSDNAIVTGKITAENVDVIADSAKVTVGGIKSSADGAINVEGIDYAVSVGTIDFDYRDTVLSLGDSNVDAFTGTIAAPVNAVNGTIQTANADTVATVTGAVNVGTISVDTDTSLKFTDAVTVATVEGDGALTIAAGKLYVSDSLSGVTLKLSDASLPNGTKVFTAATGAVSSDDFTQYGYTLNTSTGNTIDTFTIASLQLAGLQINKTTSTIANGYSETFTATAYPTGTVLPAGSTLDWSIDGSDQVFAVTSTGNTATVKVISIDPSFASENQGTLTATLYDADGYVLDDYAPASVALTAIAVPAYVSDTTTDFSVAAGATYQFKITSATKPVLTLGTSGVFTSVMASNVGNDYYIKITATGKVGSATGVFINGNKLLVATVKAGFTSDTTKDVTVKGAYTVKITSATAPTFGVGTAGVVNAAFVTKTGNDYFYKLTSVGAVGTKAGVYVNGSKIFVATVG